MKDYKPEYAKGEILVQFMDNVHTNNGFVHDLLELVGYQLKDEEYDEEYELGEAYVVQTKPGEEEKACCDLRTLRIKNHKLVDWAVRRDLKLEQRFKDLDELVNIAESIRDNAENGDTDYNKSLDEIIKYAKKLKTK
jgi:hypothetical protein